MSTVYKFHGNITFQHLQKMKEVVNSQSVNDKPIFEYEFGDGEYSNILIIKSSIEENGKGENSLRLELDDEGNITDISRYGDNNVIHIIRLIEYFSDVKIWDEYDRLDIEIWLGFYEECFDDLSSNQLELVN